LKLFLLEAFSDRLHEHELPFLKERNYQLRENGQLAEQPLRLSLARNIKFTLMIVKRLLPFAETDLAGSGWRCLLAAMKVRDRIMHPKAQSDLEVSIQEVNDTAEGCYWFQRASDVEVPYLMETLRIALARRKRARKLRSGTRRRYFAASPRGRVLS
jgi:hypothetical protein